MYYAKRFNHLSNVFSFNDEYICPYRLLTNEWEIKEYNIQTKRNLQAKILTLEDSSSVELKFDKILVAYK